MSTPRVRFSEQTISSTGSVAYIDQETGWFNGWFLGWFRPTPQGGELRRRPVSRFTSAPSDLPPANYWQTGREHTNAREEARQESLLAQAIRALTGISLT